MKVVTRNPIGLFWSYSYVSPSGCCRLYGGVIGINGIASFFGTMMDRSGKRLIRWWR
jgi:hypothetical protein